MAKATVGGVKTIMKISPRARYSAIDTTGPAPATGRIWPVNWPSWRVTGINRDISRGHRSHSTGLIGGGRHGQEKGQAEAGSRGRPGAAGWSAAGGRSRAAAEDEAQGV